MLAQTGDAGQVPLFPARGQMLDGALLVSEEQNDVHPLDRDAVRGGGRLGEPGFERGKGKGRGAQEITASHVRERPFLAGAH